MHDFLGATLDEKIPVWKIDDSDIPPHLPPFQEIGFDDIQGGATKKLSIQSVKETTFSTEFSFVINLKEIKHRSL